MNSSNQTRCCHTKSGIKNANVWQKLSSLLFTFLIIGSLSYGKNYYISSSTGSDSNSGTSQSAPWASLNKLYNSWSSIAAGDSILLKRGDTFAPSSVSNKGVLEITKDKTGSASGYITIGAYGSGNKPVLTNSNVSTYSFGLYAKTFAYFIIRDLRILGGVYLLPGEGDMGVHHLKLINLEVAGNHMVFYNPYQPANTPEPNIGKPLHHIEIGYCTFTDNVGEDAINIAETQGFNWIHHNKFYNVEEEAIDMGGGDSSIVEYNFVSGTTANGIKLHSQFMVQSNTIVRGNFVHLGAGNYSYPFAFESIRNGKVYNNTFVGIQYAAFFGWLHANPPLISNAADNSLDMSGCTFNNNIFYGTVIIGQAKGVTYTYRNGTQATINQDDLWDDNFFSNNIFYTSYDSKKIRVFNFSGTIKYDASVAPYGRYSSNLTQVNTDITSSTFATLWEGKANVTNDVYADPAFVNSTWNSATNYGDYHLTSSSPALATGKVIPEWTYDLDGKAVPSGVYPDKGAYQYNTTGGTVDLTAPYLTNASISNSTTVIVNFSESVTSATAALASNYSISGGVSVNSVSLNSAGTQATLTTSTHAAGTYTVTVNNVKDAAGNTISSGSNYAQYTLAASDVTAPTVISASISNSTTVVVSFSEAVTSATAALASNYSISGGVTVNSASLNTAGTQVTLTTSAHTEGVAYTVTVNNVKDAAGNTMSASNTALYTLPVTDPNSAVKFSIAGVWASGTPDAVTHGPEKTIDGKGYYQGDADSRWAAQPMPQYIVYDLGEVKSLTSAKFSFFKWNESRVYQYSVSVSSTDTTSWTVVVPQASSAVTEWTTNDFANQNARYIKLQFITSNAVTSTWNGFAGLWETELYGKNTIVTADIIAPEISSVQISGSTNLIVSFSEAVSSSTANTASNYSISGGISVNSAVLNSTGTQVVLTTSAHTENTNYTITVNNVEDISGNKIASSSTAQYTMPDITAPAISSASITNANTVLVTFSEAVTSASANSASNYSISGGITVISAALNSAGTQATLITSTHTEGTAYAITVSNIKDMAGNTISASNSLQYTLPVTSSSYVTLNAKVYLMGAFSSGSMTTALNSVLPLTQPYSAAPWNYKGTETLSSMPSTITDWVLVELRSSTASSSIVAKRACLLKNDGSIVDMDGISNPKFNGVEEGNYYVVIRHRNHLGIMSKNAVTLYTVSSSLYNFGASASRAYGTSPLKYLGNGLYGMRAGDGNSDGYVTAYDKNSVWLIQYNAKSTGYVPGDYNMDGSLTTTDRDSFWSPNNGCSSQIPQ